MPQTREHLTVLEALGVETGVVVLTRCDLAKPERRSRSAVEARELIDAPPVEVSARTGDGLEGLMVALEEAAELAEQRRPEPLWEEPAVLHVDRVFSLRGIGTVVTGTLWSGELVAGDTVRVLPRDIDLRIRSIEVHDRPVDRVDAGQRVALNLAGPGRDRISRGDVVCSSGAALRASYRLDVSFEGPLDLGDDERRVQVHHGTRHAPARIVALGRRGGPAPARVPPDRRGRGSVRRPPDRPARDPGRRHGDRSQPGAARAGRASERLSLIANGSPGELLEIALSEAPAGVPADPRRWEAIPLLGPARRRWAPERCRLAVSELLAAGRVEERNGLLRPASAAASDLREEPALAPPDERALRTLELIRADGASPRSSAALAEELGCARAGALAGLESLVAAGRAVRVKPDVYYEAVVLDELRRRLLEPPRSREARSHSPRSRTCWGRAASTRRPCSSISTPATSPSGTGTATCCGGVLARGPKRPAPREPRLVEEGTRLNLVGRQGSGGPSGPQSQQGDVDHRLEGSIPSPPRQPADRARASARVRSPVPSGRCSAGCRGS